MTATAPEIRTIEPHSASQLMALATKLAAEYGTAAHPVLVACAPEFARLLDDDLRDQCRPPDPDTNLFVLRGVGAELGDDDTIGPTPPSWAAASAERTAGWGIALLLLASAMGRAFGWEGQQDGRIVHDIVPSRGHETEQTGASSSVLLSPHTEDAFHPQRAHLLMLGCLRNPDGVATHAASVRRARLDDHDRAVLSRPSVPILPDDSYHWSSSGAPPAVPTLWRRDDGDCLRFDPVYTPLDEADEAYRAAYDRLADELGRVAGSVRLAPGDVLVIDNDAVVHGREPFRARYDGTDRWLKRISIRVPGRRRPSAESAEDGYGQKVVDPYA